MRAEQMPEEPSELEPESDEPTDVSDLEFPEMPCTDEDDSPWEAFIPDEGQWDPEPERGDFWIENDMAA